MRREDISGIVFGTLTALSKAPSVKGETKWICRCSCGRTLDVYTKALKRGMTRSCGCYIDQHGMSYSPEYATWKRMLERCTNPKNQDWHLYGGKGVQVRFASFSDFFAHVGARPSKAYSIDRIDGSGHYEDGNVKWSTAREQANNLNCNRPITAFGRTLNLTQWGRETGLTREVIEKRIDTLGWPIERALSAPKRKHVRA